MLLNFGDFAVQADLDKLSFRMNAASGVFLDNCRILMTDLEGGTLSPSDFTDFSDSQELTLESLRWSRTCTGGPVRTPMLKFGFSLTKEGIRFFCDGRCFVSFEGNFRWGNNPEHAVYSIRTDRQDPVLRSASGPATAEGDNALFNRETDELLSWSSAGKTQIHFDWRKKCYVFRYENGIDYGREVSFRILTHYCENKFHIPYAPISKKHGLETPPVGWMTWYAVQFRADEKIVFDNAEKFMRLFRNYAEKPVIWVDWEWCHKCWDGQGEESCDIFHPRPNYPHGLRYVSDHLKEMGFIPALWIGATNEGRKNDLLLKHPDWIAGQHAMWCGQWWLDLTHPDVIGKYIPAVFRQILEWGFEIIKWDCLPATFETLSMFHEHCHDPEQTPAQALRNAVASARKTVGENVYMLSCSGDSERDICFAMDLFDAARIGGDIFSWDDFLEQGINRVMHAYPWHNTVLYTDADNLILRPELSTLEQARTRISFYGVAGLPVTLGDEIDKLDDARIDMLRRIMPAADIRPAALDAKKHGPYFLITDLAVNRPFGSWTVAGITNLGKDPRTTVIHLEKDLNLASGIYALYDFWQKKFLGLASGDFELEIAPCDTRVIRITPVREGVPELISVSRHLTQGAVELSQVERTSSSISGCTKCAAGEVCTVTILLPGNASEVHADHPLKCNGRIAEIELKSERNQEISWHVTFSGN